MTTKFVFSVTGSPPTDRHDTTKLEFYLFQALSSIGVILNCPLGGGITARSVDAST